MKPAQSKILIVEDESIVATHIAETLKLSGYEVTDTVPSGEMALQSVGKDQPNLILMDIVLNGGMSGIETAEKINADLDVPVIFLTAYSDKKTLDKAKNIGPFGYIVKPFKEKDLNSAIQVALEKHRQIKDLKNKEEWYKGSLKNLAEAVIAIDEKGRVSFINRAAESLTGFTEKGVVGKPVQEICFLEKENIGNEDPILKVIETGNPIDLRTNFILGKGRKISAHVNVTAVRDGTGNILGAVFVLHKITDAGLPEKREGNGKGKQLSFEKGLGKSTQTVNLCPWCKKIFNKRMGRWNSIELYFKDAKPDLVFSHCMCSECAKGLGLFDPDKTK